MSRAGSEVDAPGRNLRGAFKDGKLALRSDAPDSARRETAWQRGRGSRLEADRTAEPVIRAGQCGTHRRRGVARVAWRGVWFGRGAARDASRGVWFGRGAARDASRGVWFGRGSAGCVAGRVVRAG
ncbi:hypothetical protein GCM10022380_73960 [Amycolatopsis tucumanensis]|uniref:Uncharacterized protein n=1 Tax=Amycolatopsis tucumanensis TaxID=401106 RepID=A0ABP7JHX7_9PSEU